MTDKQLAEFTERLYTTLIAPELTPLEAGGLMAALRARTPWPELGQSLKLAFFKLAARAAPREIPAASDATAPIPASPTSRSPMASSEPMAPIAEEPAISDTPAEQTPATVAKEALDEEPGSDA